MTFEVRRLGAADASVLGRVAPDVFDAPVEAGRAAAFLGSPQHLLVVAVADGMVVGQAAGVVHLHPDKPSDLFVDEVGVTPDFRRRGVARRMLEALFAWGAERGCAQAWLGTETGNHAARSLYESFGESGEIIVMYDFDLPGVTEA